MRIACTTLALSLAALPALAQNVKITPVGSLPGELCANDRATIFEDPSGVRFLYDAGGTVTGGDDPRLGVRRRMLGSHTGCARRSRFEVGIANRACRWVWIAYCP